VPLMLSVMSMAYSGQSVENVTSVTVDPAQRRSHLFNAYVDKMFARIARTEYEPYSKGDTVHWLAWLAERMSEHGQTVFLIEGIQPSWLRSHVQRRIFSISCALFLGWFLGWFLAGSWAGWWAVGGRFWAAMACLVGWLLCGLVGWRKLNQSNY